MKFLCHVVPRTGAEEDCTAWIASLGHRLKVATAEEAISILCLTRLPGDVFGKDTPFHATLEVEGRGATPERLAELLSALSKELLEVGHPERSTALMGEDHAFRAPQPAASVRHQYLMRRKPTTTHAAYLEHYRGIHAQFGLETPGIAGYVQFHVDPDASQRVARAAGLGVFDIDSVSQLYLESQEHFLAAVSDSPIGPRAIADEEQFVDRAHSMHFCSRPVEA